MGLKQLVHHQNYTNLERRILISKNQSQQTKNQLETPTNAAQAILGTSCKLSENWSVFNQIL